MTEKQKNKSRLTKRVRVGCGVLVILVIALIGLPWLLPTGDADAVDPRTLADPGGQFIAINGIETYVMDEGDRAGTPILFIHGLFGSTQVWRLVTADLHAAGFRTIAYDRPGAGLSAKPLEADYSQPAHADHAAALLDALDLDRAVIVGHSAGGNVAAHFALRHPDRVERLILVDAAVTAGGPPGFIGGIVGLPPVTRWAQVILNGVFTRETLARTLRGFYADPERVDAAWVDIYWRAFETPGAFNGLLGLTRDAAPNRLTDAQIAALPAATVLIWGTADTVTPLAQGEELAALIPGAALIRIDGAGHQPMEEAPAAFVSALTAAASADSP